MKQIAILIASVCWIMLASGQVQEPAQSSAVFPAEPLRLAVSEWDGMAHGVVEAPQLRRDLTRVPGWLPWQPGMFIPETILWLDFQQLPQELAGLAAGRKYEWHGIPLRPLQVVQRLDPVTEEDHTWPCAGAQEWAWPADKEGEQRWAELVLAQFGLKELTARAYETLATKHGWLRPRVLTLSVWLGDVADREQYERNLAAEMQAWEEEAARRQKSGDRNQEGAGEKLGTTSAGRMSLWGGESCLITNDARPFRVVEIAAVSNDWIAVTWESCSSHVYGVYTTEELSFTNVWTARARGWWGRTG